MTNGYSLMYNKTIIENSSALVYINIISIQRRGSRLLMINPKRPVGLRLSDSTITELNNLTKRYKVNQSDVVAVLVHCVHEYNGDISQEKLEEWFSIVRPG